MHRITHREFHFDHLHNRYDLNEAIQIDAVPMQIIDMLEQRKIHALADMKSIYHSHRDGTGAASLHLQIQGTPSYLSGRHPEY